MVAEGLGDDEMAGVVPSADEGRGATKGKPKLPTERIVKVDGGFKVTVSGRKGFDVLAWVEMLEDATRQARAKLEPAEQGGETAAA
jgi:hypothetical protein